MSDTDAEMGPVDYLVIEFPPGHPPFSGTIASELASLSEAELIRILDLVVLEKATDGTIEVEEFEELEDRDSLTAFEGQLAELLALEDIEAVAEAMEPGSVAGVLVWENSWAAPLAAATRDSGGQLIASGRIPTQALMAALEADETED